MTKRVVKIYKLDADANIDALTATFIRYNRQQLQDPTDRLRLYYQDGRTSTPSWKTLFTEFVEPNQPILNENQSSSESFICLMESQNNSWYAISGGFGHHTIAGSIDKTFGTDILVRTISETDQSLIAASERSVTGGQVASSIHYRKISRFFEYKRFGSITNKVDAEIRREEIARCFPSVDQEDIDKIRIAAGSNLQIKIGLDMDTLRDLIEDCDNLLIEPPLFNLNSIRPISKSQEPTLVANLYNELHDQMYDLYQGVEGAFPFDICHNDFDRYLTSSAYKVLTKKPHTLADGTTKSYFFNFLTKRGVKQFQADTPEVPDLRFGKDFFDLMRSVKTIPKDANALAGQLRNATIKSFDENGVEQTSGSFFSHVMGDVSLHGTKYFLFDNKWYQLEDEFLERLNQDLKSIYDNSQISIGLNAWPSGSEGDYNEGYIGSPNTIVTDRLLHENIEVCDLIISTDDTNYLIHVKKGFGNTVRELCNQVAVSTTRLHNAINSNNSNEYFEALFERFKTYGGDTPYFVRTRAQFTNMTLQQFKNYFISKPICVVLAFKDDTARNRSLENPADYHSAIAKFSIIELRHTLAATSIRFGICEID